MDRVIERREEDVADRAGGVAAVRLVQEARLDVAEAGVAHELRERLGDACVRSDQ